MNGVRRYRFLQVVFSELIKVSVLEHITSGEDARCLVIIIAKFLVIIVLALHVVCDTHRSVSYSINTILLCIANKKPSAHLPCLCLYRSSCRL